MLPFVPFRAPVMSEKGRHKFVENGHSYSFDKMSQDGQTKFWRCDKRHACKARVHVREGIVVRRINQHTHPGSAANVEVMGAMTALRDRAANTQDQTARVVSFATDNLSQAAHGALPKIDNMKRTIRRQRVAVQAAPANPASLADLVIPLEYTQYEKHPGQIEDFLLYDSGPLSGDSRFLIFSTERNMDILSRSSEWFMDGTFDVAPPLFTQIYSIHATYLGRTHPLVFALLPNKRQAMYESMLNELKNITANLNPTSIITDFELASIQASQTVFPNSQHSGCFFHLSQNIFRKIQQNGLQNRYETDADFAHRCKMIPALAFVPPQDVPDAFEDICDNSPIELRPVLDYFEDNYIGRPDRRGNRRNPLFPIELWNMYHRTQNGNARTTNQVEAWHRAIQTLLGEVHPTIWKFINGLIRCQKLRDVEIEQLIAGNLPPTRRPQYVSLNRRIETIVADYANRSKMEYLRGLAHNLGY